MAKTRRSAMFRQSRLVHRAAVNCKTTRPEQVRRPRHSKRPSPAWSESSATPRRNRTCAVGLKTPLRWALATCPLPQFRDADRSIAYSKEFLQRKPESADLWSNLGIGHYRANDFANAIDSLKNATELRDDADVSDCFFLAMAYWRSGDHGKAGVWYKRGIRKQQTTPPSWNTNPKSFAVRLQEC